MTDLKALIERVAQDTELMVLTSNASIARELKTQILKTTGQQQGRLSRISTLDVWLQSQAQNLCRNQALVLASQEQILQIWQQVIEADSENFPDLQATNLAPQALKSWLRLLRWQVDQKELADLEQYNDLQLSQWIRKFESSLASLGFSQTDLILNQVEQAAEKTRLLFVSSGDQLAPLHLSTLQSQFDPIEQQLWRRQNANCEPLRASFDSFEEEISGAASWAEKLCKTDKGVRVGIICAQTDSNQKLAIQALNSRLKQQSPGICLPQAAIDTGIFDSALRLLQLNQQQLSRTDCRGLIHSPFWGNYPADLEQRAVWEAELCDLQRKYLQNRELINSARSAAVQLELDRSESLAQRLEKARDLKAKTESEQSLKSPQEWAALFSQQLEILGWPGTRCSAMDQQRLTEQFQDAIQQLVSLGSIEPEISCGQALTLLRRLAQNSHIPAEAPANGINILNTVESAIGFDHLWLLDASAEYWPGLVKPDPLIPVQLQLQYQMPRCQPEQERSFCIDLFDQLRGNADQLVFSISQKDADQQIEFSPLLPEYPELPHYLELSATEIQANKSETHQPTNWQWVDCSTGPSLQQQAGTLGGSNIFNLMAASPFLAFAQIRLGARPLPEAFLGIGPQHRGNILHACLDQIWGQLKDSSGLEQTSDQQLELLVDEIIEQQLLHWQSRHFNLDQAYFEQLKASFVELILQWLNYERSRQDFSVVAREQSLAARVGPLNLNLRIDRIDQLSDGSQLLIDYKSGSSASENDLLSSPPVAAQLPLYALSLDSDISAACFALVVSGGARFVGISQQEGFKPFRWVEDWPALISQWQEDLQQLAKDYAEGDSRVYETKAFFGRRDEMACLHRLAEYEDLMDWRHDN